MQKLISLLEYSSLPAVAILVNVKHSVVKLIWFIAILLLIGFSIYFIHEQFSIFQLKREVTNSITVPEETSEFPTVSICVPNGSVLSINQISLENHKLSENKIIGCSFERQPCNWTHFELDMNDNDKVCYRFNSGRDAFNRPINIRKLSSSDLYMGFNLTLNLSNFWKGIDYNSKFFIYIDNASSIFIPHAKISTGERLKIPSGESLIRIKRTFTSDLNCIENLDLSGYKSSYIDYFNKNNKTYLRTDCFDLCYIDILCDCKIDKNFLECMNSKNYDCINVKLDKSHFETCNEKCPSVCQSISYESSLSFLGHYFDPNKSIPDNKLSLVVYYPKLEYRSSTQYPKLSALDWMSSVGGILGLFLGVGFYSLIEILTISFEAFGEFISQKFCQSKYIQKKVIIIQNKNLKDNSIQKNEMKTENETETETENDSYEKRLSQLKSVS